METLGSRHTSFGHSTKFTSRNVVCRVLAPPEVGQRPRPQKTAAPAPASPPQQDLWKSTTTFASQLLSHFRVRGPIQPDQILREASSKEREIQKQKLSVDVTPFLSPVGVWEMKHIRKLSSLTAYTYFMNLVTPRRMQRLHGLHLVTTSRACDIRPYEHSRTAEEVGADGDGMAVSMHEAKEVYRALKRSGKGGPGAAGTTHGSAPGAGAAGGATATANAADPSNGNGSTAGSSGASGTGLANNIVPAAPPLGRILWSPAEMVAAKISEAAAAAAAAAAPPLATVTESLAAGLASLPIGGALGANNRAANALLASPNSSSGTADGAGGRAKSPGGTAAGSSGQQQQQGQETQTVDDPFGQGAASAAAIAAFAAEELRQQALRGLGLGLGGNGSTGGNGSSGSGAPLRSASPSRAVSSSGGGLAPISASGLLAPGSATAAAVAAAAAVSNGASPGAAAAVAGSVLASAGGSASNAPVAAPPPGAAAAATSTASPYLCPSEWFVVDDPATDTRYFVIQGSDTLDHWKLNLTFDPVVFEDPALGVKVHRGVYEAALALYERFLPLVYEHLESSPFSKIAFTGHSIGGSMAMLLMLMYRVRGVLPPHSIATVYTFGTPSVFCQQAGEAAEGAGAKSTYGSGARPDSGADSCESIGSFEDPQSWGARPALRGFSPLSSACAASVSGCGCGSAAPLLSRLGLPQHVVRNVVMARDIVPRAFACDYSLVADILKGWGNSFKEHCCLNRHGRKHLYYFVGRMYILQPDTWHSFVAADPDHPMLPPGPGLYSLAEPEPVATATATALSTPTPQPSSSSSSLPADSPRASATASTASTDSPAPRSSAPTALAAPQPSSLPAATAVATTSPRRRVARDVVEAVDELMDTPHPLETLADAGAYLASGSISRYHNPEHYTKALGRVICKGRSQEGGGGRRLRPRGLARGGSGGGSGHGDGSGAVGVGVEAEAGQGEGGGGVAAWDSSDPLHHPGALLVGLDAYLHH